MLGFDKELDLCIKIIESSKPVIMLTGARGIGKSMLADKIAKHFVGNDIDYRNLSKGEDSYISIDKVREIKNFVIFEPSCSKYKAIVIDSVDDLNINSANALLKILEEPPRFLVIILVCHNPDIIIDTIKSRCIKIDLPAHNNENFTKIISSKISASEDDMKQLFYLSEGAPGVAINLYENKHLEHYYSLLEILKNGLNLKIINSISVDYDVLLKFLTRIFNIMTKSKLDIISDLSNKEAGLLSMFKEKDLFKILDKWDEIGNYISKAKNGSLDEKQMIFTCYKHMREI